MRISDWSSDVCSSDLRPLAVDYEEPERVASSVQLMGVKHCVITSVDRDDLKDGGSVIWAETIRAVRRKSPGTTLETLIPDFTGVWDNLDYVISEAPEVVSHHLEHITTITHKSR